MRIKIMLLGSQDTCTKLQMYLRDEELAIVGTVTDENKVLDEISKTSPDLILVAETTPMTLRACHQIYLLRPRSVPVVLSDVEDKELMQKIMQAGIHYVLPIQIDAMELIAELKGIYTNEANRILTLESSGTASNKSKVLLVFGAKDGVGKTTLAVNLAIKLAQKGNKVIVLDYNLQFGDVGAYLGINPKATIVDLLQEQSNPNADTIRQFLALHISGVSFLPAPASPEDAKAVSPSQADRIIAALRVYYDYVIIDVEAGFDDITTACIDCASQILLVTGNDIPALRNTKKCLTILQALTEQEKIHLIIGRDTNSSVKSADISRVLALPVWASIPNDEKTALTAANQGSPLASSFGKSKLDKAIAQIAEQIDGKSGFVMHNGNNKKAKRKGFRKQ